MSVLKMPLVYLVYVVALEMHRRGDNLDSLVECGRSCLNADTYSPMFEQLVDNGFSAVDGIPVRNADGIRLFFPLRLLISYAVGKSDNNACDLLISNYLGGPQNVERALRELGLERTKVAATEGAMGLDVERSYENSASIWNHPSASRIGSKSRESRAFFGDFAPARSTGDFRQDRFGWH